MKVPYDRIILIKVMVPPSTDLEAISGQLETLCTDLRSTPADVGPVNITSQTLRQLDVDWLWSQEMPS